LKQLSVNFDQFNLVQVDKDATAPQAPIKPKKALIVGFGLIFGFMLGVSVAILRRALLSMHLSRR